MMDDLIVFLRARLDVIEQAARTVPPLDSAEHFSHIRVRVAWDGMTSPVHDRAAEQYFARCEPARVLAEVDAKRRIIDEVVPQIDAMDDQIEGEWGSCDTGPHHESWLLLRLLALPYDGHPDYRESWRP